MLKRPMRKYCAMNVCRRNEAALIDGVYRSDSRCGPLHLQASTPDHRVLIDRSQGEARTAKLVVFSSPMVGTIPHSLLL